MKRGAISQLSRRFAETIKLDLELRKLQNNIEMVGIVECCGLTPMDFQGF
jgi:hypothetical protein